MRTVGTDARDFGVTRISRGEIDALADAARERGVVVFTLATGAGADKAAFFNAVRSTMPLDPPLVTYRDVWDALSDAILGGIGMLDLPRAVVAWPDADEMRRAHPVDAQVAEEILTFVAQTLAEPRFAANRPTALRIYMT